MTDEVDGRKTDRKLMEKIRIDSVRRWAAGELPLDIIRGTNYCETTIYKWINIYKEFGEEGLRSKKAPGAKSRLSKESKDELKNVIVGGEPNEVGFESSLWTRQIIQELIKKTYKVDLGLSQIGKILLELKLTPQKPVREPREQDPEAVEEWLNQTLPSILETAERTDSEVFFMDEAGYRLDDQVGRTWGERGQTPVVKSTGKRARTNSFTAISKNGAFWSTLFDGNLNSDKFCYMLDEFMKTRKRNVILIMDRHPTHTSKKSTTHYATFGEKLTVHMLPGYSPELNPVEYVNHYVKKTGPRKHLAQNIEELIDSVETALWKLKGAFKMVKSFFAHEKLGGIFS